MPKAILTTILCVVALPVMAAEFPATDQMGNVYPEPCRRDLSDVQARVVPVDAIPGNHLAVYVPSIGHKTDIILVSRKLGGWKYADAVHHEKCHALMAKLYPSTGGQWHR
jgi:hypothetical protein